MFNSYSNFLKDYSELLDHMDYYRSIDHKISSSDDENFGKLYSTMEKLVARKKFRYEFCIISIYGMLERTIEHLVEEYISKLNHVVTKYEKLPVQLKETYHKLAMQYISKRYLLTQSPKDEYYKVVNSISSMIPTNMGQYSLHEKIFSFHSSNLRMEILISIFFNIGIPDINSRFIGYEAAKNQLDQYEEITDYQKYMSDFLKELAERRNQIAHGSNDRLADLLGLDECERYLNHIKALLDGINYVCEASFIALKFKYTMTKEIGIASKVFSNLNVFGFQKSDFKDSIFVGQQIYLKYGDHVLEDTILFIKSNKEGHLQEYNRVEKDTPFDCTIELQSNKDVSKLAKYTFYLRE